MNEQLKGLLITTAGVLCVVPDSLFVRLIDAEPLVNAFWRALIAGSVVFTALLVFQGLAGFKALFRSGMPGLVYTVLLATTAPAFVLAVNNTSVANVVFIFASMPIFAAVFSRIFLGEAIERRMVLTMIAVLFGLAVIAYGSGSSEVASWRGDIWAVYISLSFAGALTAARKARGVSMVPAIPFAYFGASLLMALFVSPIPAFVAQWSLLLGHGVIIGAGSCLLAIGPRFISSAEVSLLVLLESVLAPILVWWVIDEHPGNHALVGGAIVIAALLLSNACKLVTRPAYTRAT